MTVTGNIRQEIELLPAFHGITAAELVEGLKNGTYSTTISHDRVTASQVLRVSDLEVIGVVVAQEALDDVELADFEDVEAARNG